MERLNIYHRKDGRWEGRISRGKHRNGKRKYQYIFARTKGEVVTRMAEIRNLEQPTGVYNSSMTVLWNEWFRSIQHLVKESTAANYLMKAQKHILPIFGEKPVGSIKSEHLCLHFTEAEKRIVRTLCCRYCHTFKNDFQIRCEDISYFQSS